MAFILGVIFGLIAAGLCIAAELVPRWEQQNPYGIMDRDLKIESFLPSTLRRWSGVFAAVGTVCFLLDHTK